ncbi:MAG: HD domain-containing phosphohydrolase [Chlamydiota bacterium]
MAAERVLVVDDEEAIREVVTSMLHSAGYNCQQAGSGREALAILDSGGQFELILSDLMMAELDGMGLLERTKEKYPDVPVVMVTAVHDILMALKAIRNGAYDYLLKPFEREQLLNTARRALENRRLKLENRAYQTGLEALVRERTQKLDKANQDLTEANRTLKSVNDDLQRLNAELERSYDITLEALGDALDMKDAETEGHSRRVTAFTIAIARQMGIAPDSREMRTIARGAFLHDIGKMAIPDNILRKPAKLDAQEIEVMREHCFHGYQMLKKIPYLQEPAEIVYAHQEKYDGSGYPRGLKGDEIPLGARIFAVADTLDAIINDRPYRPAQPIEAARKEIAAWSGRQFDPEVVKTFLSMSTTIWEDLRKQINARARLCYGAVAK